jgi:sterol desaturase/sphingolipid hydroxylase (fatty acid hydroxylase superfamily)
VDSVWSIVLQALERITGPFLSFGSTFSLSSLGCALVIAIAFTAFRLGRRRPVRAKVIMRALLPRRVVCASSGIDFGYLIFNTFVFSVIFGWALLSFRTISSGTFEALNAAFALRPATELPELAGRALVTLVMFLAYELGYWVHHYLCHRVAFLWEFHKVHHTANVLTPMTVFRVHPVDTLLFVNIVALFVGVVNGATTYALGVATPQFTLADTNLILVVFIHVYIHFQHSHLWIAFRGAAGRMLLSPAHHQIHHSNNPIHFNKNLGSCLAIWDWLFGTLHIPDKSPEKLHFGVEPTGHDAQTVTAAYLTSFSRAAGTLRGGPVVADEAAAGTDLSCAGNKAPA